MAILRFADRFYFTDGNWDEDLSSGREPILIDPKWKDTSLMNLLYQAADFIGTKQTDQFWMATSGSSGYPKLVKKTKVQVTNEALFWKNNLETILGWSISTVDRFQVSVPLCHLYGLIWGYLLPNILGADIKFLSSSSDLSDCKESDLLISIPYLLKKWKEKGYLLPGRILSSGSKFPVPLAQSFRSEGKVDIREIYGSTETGAMGSRNPMWKARYKLLPNLTPGFILEQDKKILKVKSEFVSETGLEVKEMTGQKISWIVTNLTDAEGFFVTNDCGDLSEIGWNYLGRIDRIAKVKGKRISLDTIESLIGAIREVSDVAVVSYEKEDQFEIVCFIHILGSKEEFENSLKLEVPSSHIPTKIFYVDRITKLPNGKTDYQSLIRQSR